MLAKLQGHLEKGCMNTRLLHKRMDNPHQSHVTLKVMDTATNICSSQCWSGAHQNLKQPTLPDEDVLSCLGYSDCTLWHPLASTNLCDYGWLLSGLHWHSVIHPYLSFYVLYSHYISPGNKPENTLS